jgi:hypothetical protein
MFFSFLITRRKSAATRRTARLRLELLEERTLLNSRFVVPMASADNVTNFASLQAALATPGLNTGDIIQIEPGSAPGNIRNADLPAVAGLTVRGDPAALLSAIPQFTVSDAVTVGAAQEGFTFRRVNIGLIETFTAPLAPAFDGELIFTADGTIAGSTIVNISAGNYPYRVANLVEFDGAADVLTGTTLANQSPLAVSDLLDVRAPDGSSTLVSNNVFDVSNIIFDGVAYGPLNSPQKPQVTDQLIGNTFINQGKAVLNGIAVGGTSLVGLTIQDNTISLAPALIFNRRNTVPPSPPSSEATGITLSNCQNTQVIGNVINLSATIATGIAISTGDLGPSSTIIAGNQINAGSTGTGISFTDSSLASAPILDAVVQGNDFHNDQIGVQLITGSIDDRGHRIDNGVVTVDLGGGSLGSLGGNDFRGFTAPATASSGAIVLTTFSSAQKVVTAQKESFAAGVDPQSVVWDGTKSAGLPIIDESNNLTGNAAFVAALYADLLKRAGDTSSATDAGGLIAALNTGALTQAAAASALVHSAEALGVQVDGLYLKLLGRPSDPTGRAGFVSFLQHGGTVEQAIVLMVASPEYAALNGSDAGFVQSLYTNLLGRAGSDAEVAGVQAVLPFVGRANSAAAFLRTTEFRTDMVDQFYNATPAPTSIAALFPPLLHRPAPATTAEISGWVFSGLSLLDIETAFVSSSEFFVNG